MRIINAIKKYLIKDTRYFFTYIYRYFQDNYKNNANFISDAQLTQALREGKSILRLGDGEIGLLHFHRILYQDYSDEIRNEFLAIIKDYSSQSNYIMGIPLFVNMTNTALKAQPRKDTFQCWMPLKITFELLFKKRIPYMDAHLFYRKGKFEQIILPYLISKKIILVTNKNNISQVMRSHFHENIYVTIEVPPNNTYEIREVIEHSIVKTITDSGLSQSNYVIVMAAGLCKTIIPHLSSQGYQLFDIGKGFEAYCNDVDIEKEI